MHEDAVDVDDVHVREMLEYSSWYIYIYIVDRRIIWLCIRVPSMYNDVYVSPPSTLYKASGIRQQRTIYRGMLYGASNFRQDANP